MNKLSIFLETLIDKNISGSSFASTYLRGPSIDTLNRKKSDYENEINNLKKDNITQNEFKKIIKFNKKIRSVERLLKYKQEKERLGL